MLLNIIFILSIILFSIKLENKFKVPMPISLITLSLTIGLIFQDFIGFTTKEFFAEEMIILIVILILSDTFMLKLKDIKENYFSLIILAGLFVVLSVLLGVLSKNFIFSDIDISVGALIALFAMITATDPVSVISVFNQYKLPHKLKFLAEGESLFNDAIALIMFSAFGLYLLSGNELTVSYVSLVTLETIAGSVFIGFITGFIGLSLMKTTKDIRVEFILILLIAYSSFYIAEHITIIGNNHLSGILSEIVAILTLMTFINKSFEKENALIESDINSIIHNESNGNKVKQYFQKKLLNNLIINITDTERTKDIYSFINVLALLANGILFISLAQIINFNNLILYWKEILLVFLMSTLIRFILLFVFQKVANFSRKIPEFNFKWTLILTFSGIKGGLSIVMLNMLFLAIPDFQHKILFESIITGVILLSTYLYVLGLIITISFNKKQFLKECEFEKH